VGDEVLLVLSAWVSYLQEKLFWGPDDPLFPATRVVLGNGQQFIVCGLDRRHWSNATPIRKIFKEAFTSAGLEYFNPHSFRKTLAQLGEKVCQTPEEFKAWSKNLGHEQVMTTFSSYVAVASRRQAELIRALKRPKMSQDDVISQMKDLVNSVTTLR
jgi:integrase